MEFIHIYIYTACIINHLKLEFLFNLKLLGVLKRVYLYKLLI